MRETDDERMSGQLSAVTYLYTAHTSALPDILLLKAPCVRLSKIHAPMLLCGGTLRRYLLATQNTRHVSMHPKAPQASAPEE